MGMVGEMVVMLMMVVMVVTLLRIGVEWGAGTVGLGERADP